MRGAQYVRAVQGHRQALQVQLDASLAAQHSAQRDRDELGRRRVSAMDELLQTLLPDLGDATLSRAAGLTGYTPLLTRPRDMAEQAAQIQRRLQAIEAEPAYRDRQLLRAPRIGTLTRAIAELEDFRAAPADVIARCAHPRLDRLMESGYGTPRYDTPFWRLSYYRDWEASDEILARFKDRSKKLTFADVRDEFLQACSTVKVYDERLGALRAEFAAGEALEREHAELIAAREGLPQKVLGEARQALGGYLLDTGNSEPAALGERFAAAPEVLGLLKRVLGLAQQERYLDQAQQGLIQTETAALLREVAKADQQIVKFSRPKNLNAEVPADLAQQSDQRWRMRAQKSERRLAEYQQTHDAVVGFNRYDSARLASDFLWWDLMTGGRLHGGYIPEVAAYRQRYPHQNLMGESGMDDAEWMEAAAADAALRRGQGARAGGAGPAARGTRGDDDGFLGVDIS